MSILAGPRQACCCVPKGPEAARTGTGSAGSALIQSPKCTGCTGSSSPNPTALNPPHLSDGKTSVPTNPRLSSTSCPNLCSGWQLGAGTVLTWRMLVCPHSSHPAPALSPPQPCPAACQWGVGHPAFAHGGGIDPRWGKVSPLMSAKRSLLLCGSSVTSLYCVWRSMFIRNSPFCRVRRWKIMRTR